MSDRSRPLSYDFCICLNGTDISIGQRLVILKRTNEVIFQLLSASVSLILFILVEVNHPSKLVLLVCFANFVNRIFLDKDFLRIILEHLNLGSMMLL